MESTGAWAPGWFLALFLAGSLLMVWRLEVMGKNGFEGTVLGTLVMPYCSGLGNLIFAFLLGLHGGPGKEVLTNALVNNVSNLTVVLGLPALFCGLNVLPAQKAKPGKKKNPGKEQQYQLNRLSLLLTLTAAVFFTLVVWALGREGTIGFNAGLVLVGLFLFWQCFHVFDVLRNNVRQNKSLTWKLLFDLALLGVGAYAIYVSTDWLVHWVETSRYAFIKSHLGWLSGWLMVLPNALLAVYYAWRGNPEVVYASQVGDGHISIPLSIGIYALCRPISVPAFFNTGIELLLAAGLLHFCFVAFFGRLPRWMGLVLVLAYAVFLVQGLG